MSFSSSPLARATLLKSFFFFFKQKTAYEITYGDWSSDVCSSDLHAPKKRSIANALTVEFKDGSKLKEVVCEYPIGHRRRRKEGMPILVEKFKTNLARRFPPEQQKTILELCADPGRLEKTPVNEF